MHSTAIISSPHLHIMAGTNTSQSNYLGRRTFPLSLHHTILADSLSEAHNLFSEQDSFNCCSGCVWRTRGACGSRGWAEQNLLNQGDLRHLDLDQLYRLYWVLQMLGREIILLHIIIEDLVVNIIEVKHLLLREEQPRVWWLGTVGCQEPLLDHPWK